MNHAPAAGGAHKPHVLPLRIYGAVWLGLLVLTVITVKVSYYDFGVANLLVAMAVATVKASLVVLFFMHLKYDEKFNAIIFVGCLTFLSIFFVLTLADTMERGKVDPLEARSLKPVPARPELGGTGAGLHGEPVPGHGGPGQGKALAESTGFQGQGDSLMHSPGGVGVSGYPRSAGTQPSPTAHPESTAAPGGR
jgi:cytochrome c oxidase subunit 4